MSNYDNNNTGALFKADKKSERHPDYTGSAEINGVEYYVSSWIKQSKAGKNFMSMSFTPKEQQQRQSQPTHVNKIVDKVVNDLDDDLPF